MDDLYFFWNAFNLIAILTGTLGAGLLAGGIVSSLVTVLIQVEDPALSFFGRLSGCLLGVYLMAPFVLSSYQEFAQRIWGGADVYQ